MSAQLAGERADAQEAAPPALRRRRRLTSRQRNAIVFGIIGLAFLIPLRGLLRSQGPPMEEGFMLVFPERLLHGDLPNRDFLHLYGPGSLWALAGVYKVFGTSLTAERLVALLQQIGVVMGVYALARHWGRTVALPCALISLVIIVPPIGLTALGWVGGVALGLLGLAVALEGRRIADPRRAGRYALLGGVLLGFALLYRLDLILAVGLAVLVMLRGLDRARAKRLLGGVALGASPYVIQLATAGVGATVSGMILDPVIYLRGGRRLPIPPPWDHLDGFLQRAGNIQQLSWPVPSFSTAQQLTIWFFFLLATVLFLLLVARWRLRQNRTAFNPRVLATVAVFSLGLMPQAIQRVDSAHFAWVGCVPIAFLPIAVTEVLRAWKPRLHVRARNVAAGAGVLLFLFAVLPYFTIRTYTDYSLQSLGYHRIAYKIEHKGRIFYYGRPEAARRQRAASRRRSHLQARGSALRRPDRPPQDAVQRRVPLLHAPRPRPRDLLHRDGPRCGQRLGLEVGERPPLGRHRDPVIGLERLGRAERRPELRIEPAQRDPEAGLLSRRLVRTRRCL